MWYNSTCVCTCKLSVFAYLVVDCGHPGTPSKGSSNFTSTILDATVTHSCDSGYMLCNGDDTRTCQPYMLWSGILPECISEFAVHLTYSSDVCILLIGVTVTVSNSTNYVVDETDGAVDITLMFDQPSCQSITVIARPQVRSVPDATGNTSSSTTLSMFVRIQ